MELFLGTFFRAEFFHTKLIGCGMLSTISKGIRAVFRILWQCSYFRNIPVVPSLLNIHM